MKCAVLNCHTGYKAEVTECSLFIFPVDPVLRKKLIKFCRQHKDYDFKIAYICMKHFVRDDFENIFKFEMGKYTNRTLLSAIIYVVVTQEKDYYLARQSSVFTCHPVFRTRKCLKSDNSTGCCMVFIDELGRVYKNWKYYLENNVLPKGTMIAPANGIYTFNNNDEIELEYHLTPAAYVRTRILNTTNTVAGVGGLVATVPIAAAALTSAPIAAPIMITATTVAIASTAYSTIRSVMELTDRHIHGQSTALTDRAARGSWIGVAGGFMGLGATGATTAMRYAAGIGQEISMATKVAVSGMNATSILVSGSGIVNGVYDLYLKINANDSINSMDVLQLASSLLVFTHSINNFKIASKVSTSRRASNVMRWELQNQLRNFYNKISCDVKNRIGVSNSNTAQPIKLDILRTVDDIPYKETLMSLHNIYTHLIGIAGDGGLGTTGTGVDLRSLQMVNHFIEHKTTDEINFVHLVEEYGYKFIQHITNMDNLLNLLGAMCKYLCERVFRFILQLAKIFIDNSVDEIDRVLNTFVSTEVVLYKILMHCFMKYSNFSYDYLESKTAEILIEIEAYFNSLNPINYTNARHSCQYCNGYFYTCNL